MLNVQLNYVSFNRLNSAIHSGLHRVPRNVDMIVGIPRSGMIPAYLIGLYLNVPVTDITSFLANQKISHGSTRKLKVNLTYPQDAKVILLMDDSYNTGQSFKEAMAKIKTSTFKGKVVTGAAIVVPGARKAVDVSFLEMRMPRVFEWNIFHHALISNACLDMDGVLCEDPTERENDDGENYLKFLESATPRFIPTQKVAHIVSARLEKYRPQTEA